MVISLSLYVYVIYWLSYEVCLTWLSLYLSISLSLYVYGNLSMSMCLYVYVSAMVSSRGLAPILYRIEWCIRKPMPVFFYRILQYHQHNNTNTNTNINHYKNNMILSKQQQQ